jgi:hypothetical protein
MKIGYLSAFVRLPILERALFGAVRPYTTDRTTQADHPPPSADRLETKERYSRITDRRFG